MLENGTKRMRKGTKSCVSCRQRKIRCIFSSPRNRICQGCAARGQTCEAQVFQPQRSALNAHRSPSRASHDRLSRIEEQLARLAGSIQGAKEESSSILSDTAPSQGSEAPEESPPTHLRLIFDNVRPDDGASSQSAGSLPSKRRHEKHLQPIRSCLQRLVPSKDDVYNIASSSAPWFRIYQVFFPVSSFTLIGNPSDPTARYDELMGSGADVVALAAFLVSLAVTVFQVCNGEPDRQWSSLGDPSLFVHKAVHAVKTNVISNNELAASIEGIELILFYVRLQLARGAIREMWLSLRHAVALSEFIGLQRTLYNNTADTNQSQDGRSVLFEAVCATDRMVTMMFNLPSATAAYKLPQRLIVDGNGQVLIRTYMIELASIAMKVQDIDEELVQGQAFHDVYEKVLLLDSKLRALASKVPASWWHDSEPVSLSSFEPYHLARCLHAFVTVRIHLHSVMRVDAGEQYAYSSVTCITACQKAVQRYLVLRQVMPPGFFLKQVFQMQIFAVATILLLYQGGSPDMLEASGNDAEERMQSVTRVVESLESDHGLGMTDFAAHAASALRSLQGWIQSPSSLSSESLTLRIPMLGKVLIGPAHRRTRYRMHSQRKAMTGSGSADQPPESWPGMNELVYPTPSDGQDGTDPLSWLLELDIDNIFDDSLFTGYSGPFNQM